MISVALCTWNGERFLAQQLESILSQDPPPGELVLSDDASSDRTLEIAEEVVAGYPGTTVRILRNETALGVAANFQQAVLATTGDLVALSDQDDVWHPGRLARMTEEFDAKPELLLLHTDARLIDSEGEPIGHTVLDALEVSDWERDRMRAGRAIEVLLRRNLAVGATTVFRRSLLAHAVPFAPGWIHDEWLAIVAAALGDGTVGLIEDPLIDYRQHGSNQIGARRLSFLGKLRRLREPRRRRNARLLLAFGALRERVRMLPVSEEVRHRIEEKAGHEQVRSDLPEARRRRLLPVLTEWRTGRYASSGRGLADAVRDLIQPVD